ncbi:MAG: cysteine hydrolase [Chloroflexi bacterium]|nr:cysteine hydrolase [Chloroflexota bacterium]
MGRDLQEGASKSRASAYFSLEADTTALVIVDMQYASACRTTGKGKIAKETGQADALEWRFSRIENVAVPNIKKLLDFFRKNKLRVVYLTNGSDMPDYSDCLPHRAHGYKLWNNTKGTREHEILDEIKPLPNECVINKKTSSAFNSTNIDMILTKAMGIRYLVFTGVSTDACVENTVRDAVDCGYRCIMVEDACACDEEAFHNAALAHFGKRFFGRVGGTNEVIEELSAILAK